MIPYFLLALGLLLIFIEFFLPGGALAIAGGVFIVMSIILFAVTAKSGIAVLFYIIGTVLAVALLVKFTLWRMRRGHLGKSIFLNTHQEGYTASTFEKEFIGKDGVALTDLKPAGHILIEGKRFQAIAKTGYLQKGSQVTVVGGEGAHFIVVEKEKT